MGSGRGSTEVHGEKGSTGRLRQRATRRVALKASTEIDHVVTRGL